MKTKPKITRTPVGDRGLGDYLSETDTYGHSFTVRDSSAASQQCVWIFLNDQVTGLHLGHETHAALHLNVELAEKLSAALDAFVARAKEQP